MKNIFVLSHCILNTASKVSCDESKLQEESILRRKFLGMAIEKDVQLLQLPCPEFILYGSRRWGHVKSQFDHPFFRKTCRELFDPVRMQLSEYLSDPERFTLLGIVSVEGSPSCGLNLTCNAPWGGEMEDLDQLMPVQMIKESGIFMETIKQTLLDCHMSIPLFSLQDAVKRLSELQ